MKRIWFKEDCIEWIRTGKKTTTFRTRRHDGDYVVVRGSRYKALPVSPLLIISLRPVNQYPSTLLPKFFRSEGDFKTRKEFEDWLRKNKLYQDNRWLWQHKIKIVRGKK